MGFLEVVKSLDWGQESYTQCFDFVALPFLAALFFFSLQFEFSSTDLFSRLKLKTLYMYAGGFYTYSIFALIFWEMRRSDFRVSTGHRVATCILMVFSYVSSFAIVGSIVLAIHDASDVFLEVGKMSKYSSAEALASVSFVLFVTSYEVVQTLDKEKHKLAGPIYYYIFNFLLFSLLVLHIYWWILMFQMLVKQVQARGQFSEDVRSDSEDEDQHEDWS